MIKCKRGNKRMFVKNKIHTHTQIIYTLNESGSKVARRGGHMNDCKFASTSTSNVSVFESNSGHDYPFRTLISRSVTIYHKPDLCLLRKQLKNADLKKTVCIPKIKTELYRG